MKTRRLIPLNLQLFSEGGEMGVESLEVATPIETQEPESTPIESGEEVQVAAEPDKVEKAFAARLAKEREKIEQEYNPYKSLIEQQAQQYNMTPQEYIEAIEQQRQEAEKQRYIEQGLDPDLINELVEKHPAVQYANQIKTQEQQRAEEQAKFNAETQEFAEMFPDLDPSKVPQSVWDQVAQIRQEKGLSIVDSYLRVTRTQQPNIEEVKQQAIKEYVEKLKTGQRPVEGSGSSPVIVTDTPKTFEDARKQALEVMRQTKQF